MVCKTLSLQRDFPEFIDAAILVSSNLERSQLNLVCLENIAREHGLPIFRWRKELDLKAALSLLSDQHWERLYRQQQEWWEHVGIGAPGVLGTIINPAHGPANGTPVRYASFTLCQDACLPEILTSECPSFLPGQMIDVPCPDAINVQRRLPRGNGHDSDEAIPVFHNLTKIKFVTGSKALAFFQHGVKLSFAVTFTKPKA